MIDCMSEVRKIEQGIIDRGRGGHLAVISVGDDPASQSYVRAKKKACERVGFGFTHKHFPELFTTKEDVFEAIEDFNRNKEITGIIVQLPLPGHLKSFEQIITNKISRKKDVDGLRTDSLFKPCTPEGILHILRHELGSLEGKTVCVVGRGKLVGKPLREMLDAENATVISCNSHTTKGMIDWMTWDCNAVVFATGAGPWWFDLEETDTSPYPLYVDCGCYKTAGGEIVGELHHGSHSAFKVTPVPGGVGPMTVAYLLLHTERKE